MSTRTRGTRGRSRISVRYFDDRILLTESHAWAYFRLPAVPYEFITPEEREALATNITVALAAIRMPEAEVHLRIAHRSYPAAEWAAGLDATSDGGPGWLDYLEEMYRHVWAKDFWAKEIYLGVRLGQRGMRAQLSGGVLSQFINAYQSGERAMGLDDEAVPAAEIAKWTEQAERFGRALGSSALTARSASSDEIAWLFRHTLRGTLGEPAPSAAKRRTWGAGEIESLVEGQIHNGRNLLCLEHPAGSSYTAFLSFSRFPDVMSFPEGEPWLHFADSLPFPVEISSRMKLIPPAKASKDVGRRLAHARDMDAHIREAGAEAPLALAEQIEAARMLEHGITKERLPFVYGWHRLIVTGPSRELCLRRAEALIEHYRDIGIDVVNSTGDQFSLLRESLPGDRVRLNSYVQRQPLYTIAGGVPTATVDLGDSVGDGAGWIGPYIGETLGRARSVVHFDPLVAAARNRPTAIAITGEPGGGKTTLALLLLLQLALRGVTVAAIDPKGDAEPLVRLLASRGRRARILPLGAAAPGLLDPFSFGDDLAEKRTMATETLRLLLPRMSEERESAMIQAVGVVAGQERPSLGKVIGHLEESPDPASRNLGAVLRSMSEMRLARLCFAPSGGEQIDAAGWTTVFTLAGLSLPDVGVHRDDFSYEQRLSVALLYLVSQFARRLAEQHGAADTEGDLPRRGVGDHLHPAGGQADSRGVPDGPVPQHGPDPRLAERRGLAERAGDQLPVRGVRVPLVRAGGGRERDGAARGGGVGRTQCRIARPGQRGMHLQGFGRPGRPDRCRPDHRRPQEVAGHQPDPRPVSGARRTAGGRLRRGRPRPQRARGGGRERALIKQNPQEPRWPD